jgi:radical SAM protein with 4Fe4S-binding SPASM domain
MPFSLRFRILMDRKKYIEDVVRSTKEYIYVRTDDNLLIVKPNRVMNLNDTGAQLLSKLYASKEGEEYAAVEEITKQYGQSIERVEEDACNILKTVIELLKSPYMTIPGIKQTQFGSHKRDLPVLSEIALTYGCNNNCVFCYASSPERVDEKPQMTTDQVKNVLNVIWNEAKVPTVSFTGGEPTMRQDLVELVKYAVSIGLRANLISNGIICGVTDLAQKLKDAGLSSAQISLESAVPEVHDKIVGHKGAFAKTVEGFKRLKALGIHTHINTTICKDNIDTVHTLPKFAKEELELEYQSMNMVIRTGHACDHPDEIGYTEVAKALPRIHEEAKKAGIKLVWYSPMPYCIINTVSEGIGSTTCAAADGLLSVAPDGSVLPCSSFSNGFGNLLTQSFRDVWFSRPALYFRKKEFIPPKCKSCEYATKCLGACPLYWDNMGDFKEIPGPDSKFGDMYWKAKRKYVGKCRPVSGVAK